MREKHYLCMEKCTGELNFPVWCVAMYGALLAPCDHLSDKLKPHVDARSWQME